jgi:hypothetical protein
LNDGEEGVDMTEVRGSLFFFRWDLKIYSNICNLSESFIFSFLRKKNEKRRKKKKKKKQTFDSYHKIN